MSKTNCINCGAAKDVEDVKCPFCGTSYFDMTAIDLNESLPVALMIRKGRFVFQMLAKPELQSVSIEDDIDYVTDWKESHLGQFTKSRTVTAGVQFRAVPSKLLANGGQELFTVTYYDT